LNKASKSEHETMGDLLLRGRSNLPGFVLRM
jgi:hypothetical protein